jgi:RNA polymerase sigma-32 factor
MQPDPEQQIIARQIAEQQVAVLHGALTVLSDRERRILIARRLAEPPLTLAALAVEFGISRERVRQIEVRALKRVGTAMRGT